MANTLTPIIHKILSKGLMALREQVVMPRLVNFDYSTDAAKRGDTIDVPIPASAEAKAVAPATVPPSQTDKSPTTVAVKLDSWFQSDFHLTDKEMMEVDRNEHFTPMQMSEAIRALANEINKDIWDEYKSGIFGFVGTPATTPFATVQDAVDVRKELNKQVAPRDSRRAVVDFDAEANMLILAPFRDVSASSDRGVIIEGEVGRKYGFDWFSDDHVPTHTAGTASGATTDAAGYALGIKTITLASAGTGTVLAGDIMTFAGDTQTYCVVTGDTDVSNGGTLIFEPGLKVVIPTAATAITLKATHVVNLAFHRDAIAYATRPLISSLADLELGHRVASMQDPKSGVVLRLEVSRQYKQTMWDFDVLWGTKLVRPELAARIAG